jgi:Ca2+-binding EF-hand superfamily protein
MRIKFWALSAFTGCLFLLLALVPGRTQNPDAIPDREDGGQPQVPPGAPPGAAPGGAQDPAVAVKNWIDERFRKLDRNGDGFLSFDEMTENLRAEKDKWDVNKDGVIDLDEWREYVAAFGPSQRHLATDPNKPLRVPGRDGLVQVPPRDPQGAGAGRPKRNQGGGRPPFNDPNFANRGGNPGEPRPQVAARPPFNDSRSPHRNKKTAQPGAIRLPRNIPLWFKEYDIDGDGQVALYEWKAKKDDVREFRKYDLNGDGFITVEELIQSGQFAAGTPAPPTLGGIPAESGDFFYFELTGAIHGGIWGTDIYTYDSPMATAAVHAGILRLGETGLVKVTVLPGYPQYAGTVANGVTTQGFGAYPKSFRVEAFP